MGNQLGSQVAEDAIATIDEIEEAINKLTTAQNIKLKNYASFKIAQLKWGRKAKGYNGEDLLFEAMTQIIEGRRGWRKNKVEFFWHLVGAIKSIASHFWDNSDDKIFFESELLITTESGETQSPIAKTPSLTNQEENLAAKQQIEEIKKLFSGDSLVLEIIDGLEERMPGPEIQEVLDISQKEYETAMKRMRRKVRKIENERKKQ